jgi:hypothetical protein
VKVYLLLLLLLTDDAALLALALLSLSQQHSFNTEGKNEYFLSVTTTNSHRRVSHGKSRKSGRTISSYSGWRLAEERGDDENEDERGFSTLPDVEELIIATHIGEDIYLYTGEREKISPFRKKDQCLVNNPYGCELMVQI